MEKERTAPVDPRVDLSGALHDISNALTVLLGWVAEARAPAARQERVAEALEIIEQRARAARDLARRAIGASVPPRNEDVPVESLLGEIADSLELEAKRAGIRLAVSGTVGGTTVNAADDLSQVIVNLALNAIAHTPEGGEVAIRATVDGQNWVRFEVRDSGPGVPRERRDHIFEGYSNRPGGAGVGLRHARELTRILGGDLTLGESQAGAHFQLSWPQRAELSGPPKRPRKNLHSAHILVIEDDTGVCELVELALTGRGATVQFARTFSDVAADTGVYDAIVLDMSPIRERITDFLELLRGRWSQAVLVVASGYPADVQGLAREHPVHLLPKPYEVRELSTLLENVLRRV